MHGEAIDSTLGMQTRIDRSEHFLLAGGVYPPSNPVFQFVGRGHALEDPERNPEMMRIPDREQW
jgi:hypothetical protein